MNDINNYGGPSREVTFKLAAKLFEEIGGKVIVETGCYNGDASQGLSTVHLSALAEQCRAEFHSIDNDHIHVVLARSYLESLGGPGFVHLDNAVDWLRTFMGRIDLLYLDAGDYLPDNPAFLREQNLAQLLAALPKMSNKGLILLDDWNHGVGEWIKCPDSKSCLDQLGWKLLLEDYQLLYQHP